MQAPAGSAGSSGLTPACHDGRVPQRRPRPRRPTTLGPAAIETFAGGVDPALQIEAAHASARAVLERVRSADDHGAAERLLSLLGDEDFHDLAQLWSSRPADTLPGVLWRIHALIALIRADPAEAARAFEAGRTRAPVHEAIAGVAEPLGAGEVLDLAGAVLRGVFTGDLAVALERAGAWCRVVATGWAVLADDDPNPHAAGRLTVRAAEFAQTGAQLEVAATRWREGTLH